MATPKVNRPYKKPGRKSLEIDDAKLKEIETLAGRSLTQEEMASYFGISSSTWYKLITKHPQIRDIIKRGRAKTKSIVVGKLMKLVQEGNVTAIIFYLKTQHRWSEHSPVENDKEKSSASLSITVNDPIEVSKIYQKIMSGS